MAGILAWLAKFFGGFKFWGGAVPFERLGKILFVAVICVGICFGFWKVFIEKKIQNVTHYDNCTVTQNAPVVCPKEPVFELLKIWRLRLFSVR